MTLVITDRERAALADAARFPLFAAVAGRRSRRFPAGGRIPSGALAYTSRRPVQPLSAVERAMLLSFVAGVTGWHFGITHHPGYAPALPNYSGSAVGRVFPSAAGFHTSQLFFTDDTGVYLLPTRDQPPREFDTVEEWISHTADSYVQISDRRLHLPREEPYMEGHNIWIGNHPGSLLAFPVADLAEHLLENLWFFAANGYPIVDDVNSRTVVARPAGFSRLAHADDPIPLSFVEQYTLTEASAELSIAVHNGALVLQAMGLGGWIFDGLDRLSVLGGSGDPRAPGPWSDSPGVRGSALPPEAVQELVTVEAAYIYDAFGKLPGTVPTVHVLMYLQAQHLDTDFYDTHFRPGGYLASHAEHQDRWHG